MYDNYKNRTKPAAPRLNYGSVPRDHLLAAVDHPHNKEQSGWISRGRVGQGEGTGARQIVMWSRFRSRFITHMPINTR